MEAETHVVSTKKPSMIGMITSPVEQFNRMKEHNPIFLPFAVLTITGVLFIFISIYLSNIPEMEELKDAMGIGAAITTGIGIIIAYLLNTLILKIAMMVLSNDTKYSVLLSMGLYIGIISILSIIINSVLMLVLNGSLEATYTSLAILAEKGTRLYGILSVFDVFSIWGWVLEVIGLQIVAGLTKKQAIGVIVFFTVFQIILGAYSI